MEFQVIHLVIAAVIAFVAAAIIFFPLGISYRKKVSEKEISSAEEEPAASSTRPSRARRARSGRPCWRQRKRSYAPAANMRRKKSPAAPTAEAGAAAAAKGGVPRPQDGEHRAERGGPGPEGRPRRTRSRRRSRHQARPDGDAGADLRLHCRGGEELPHRPGGVPGDPRGGDEDQGDRAARQGGGGPEGPRSWPPPSSAAPRTPWPRSPSGVVPLPNDEMKGRIIGREAATSAPSRPSPAWT